VPSASSSTRCCWRSTLRIAAAYGTHSTSPWWLVATARAVMPVGRSGSQVRRGPPVGTIHRGDVVGHVDRYPVQHPHGLVGGPADFQHVADHQRDAEPLANLRSAPERQRDREPGVIDSVQQPPQAVEHAQNPAAAGVRSPGHDPVEQAVIPVVVAYQRRAAPAPPPASSRSGTVADSTAPVPPRPPDRLPAGRPAASWRAPVLACAPRAAPRPARAARCSRVRSPGSSSSQLRTVNEIPPARRTRSHGTPSHGLSAPSPSRQYAAAIRASLASPSPPPTAANPAR
jgi:hypothetical protein